MTRTPSSALISVVIPLYDEEATIATVLARAGAVLQHAEFLVVDDASRDRSATIVEELASADPRIRLLRHAENRGKGAALHTGFAAARGEVVLVHDADLEYDPRDWPRLLRPLEEGLADAVFGSRFIGSEPHRVMRFWHAVVNRFLTTLCNLVANLNLTDMEVCSKAIRRSTLQRLHLREERFGFEPEVTIKLARARARIFEVGISYAGRTFEEGKKIRAKDGLRALWCILRYGLAPSRPKPLGSSAGATAGAMDENSAPPS